MRRLKVFVIGTRGFPGVQGGVEKHCEALYPRLVELGCDVTVFTRRRYVQVNDRRTAWKGVTLHHLWCPTQRNVEALIHTFLGICRTMGKQVDVLHFHAIGPSLLVPLAKVIGLKVVVTHHGPDYRRAKWGKIAKMALRAGEYSAAKWADRMIVISKEIKERVTKQFGRMDMAMIPNGVDTPRITEAGKTLADYGLQPRRYAFAACRFVPEKGLHDLINAYVGIRGPQFKLVIAGDADHESSYSRGLKESVGENADVVFTGFLSGSPLYELFSNAGLFILPSYYEGLPIALLEALSYQLPVLVSDIEANREVPIPTYRFFERGDVVGLRSKMVELMERGIAADEIRYITTLLHERYNWDVIARETYKVYTSLAGGLT